MFKVGFPVKDMDSSASTTLFPLHCTKTLHVVRHAQRFHNVEGERNHDAYLSEELFDPQLTPLGWQQLVFPDAGDYADGIDVTPLMVENGGNSNRSAISSLNTPPFVAVELCREHLVTYPLDVLRLRLAAEPGCRTMSQVALMALDHHSIMALDLFLLE
ncbi:hypothetical protein MKX01_017127 [Papaver californicum]|nr:hypothetical protein MKX01_017127 [Papaver californicum]